MINKFQTIKRDIMVNFSILNSGDLIENNSNLDIQAKFLLNQEK